MGKVSKKGIIAKVLDPELLRRITDGTMTAADKEIIRLFKLFTKLEKEQTKMLKYLKPEDARKLANQLLEDEIDIT